MRQFVTFLCSTVMIGTALNAVAEDSGCSLTYEYTPQNFGGGVLPQRTATFPAESRFCAQDNGSGPYRFYICKNGTWTQYSADMQKEDGRCAMSGIEPQHFKRF
ncbi:hypothetical protein [Noviherbaspirillum suwonense]|uniref:Uncharacterized protein n=1 Tax=Noviherbaspirillum suwonense TaxID=1224511 RepID=A0ABY1QUW0_9BURK|nr:hypothetical protein [Noviherbaspirillum suwonense]SMP81580.1 hypothetical protein SAMN06295970_14519 [Noviherbaspirillum suwonense]